MNFLFHFFFGYLLASQLFGIDARLVPLVLIVSALLDLDHIPYLLRKWRHVAKTGSWGSASRTRFHELYGALIASVLLCIAYFFFPLQIVMTVAICIMAHFAVDFLIGHTRPFYPYENTEVFCNFIPNRMTRLGIEIFLTCAAGALFLAAI
jgi:hypothetical protein